MSQMLYRTVHEDLLTAFPELGAPYQRLLDDWDDVDGEPPGQYTVYNDTFGTMVHVTLALPERTMGREQLLHRAVEFGETLLAAADADVRDLGIDALAERLDCVRGGPGVAQRLGGPLLQSWLRTYSSNDWKRPATDEIIDLWGVREAISHLFPATPARTLPGISYPAHPRNLETLAAAREADDGVVLLAAYGTTELFAVARAGEVRADSATLDHLAVQLAYRVGGDSPAGHPMARYCRIPRGERVWNMHLEGERHSRLWNRPWVANALAPHTDLIISTLRGEAELFGSDATVVN